MKTFLALITGFYLSFSTSWSQAPTVPSTDNQNTRIVRIDGNIKTEYQALKNDTSIRNGYYNYYYKNKLIEKGTYCQNKKCGSWQFFNLKGIFDYEYNYELNKITRLAGNLDPKQDTPCLFKGSPLIPYLYIVQKMRYPEEAQKHNISGQVVLALKINREGQIWAMYLSQKLHPTLDSEVMRVAREFPSNWEWLPATHLEQPFDAEYLITIEFEID